MNTNSTHLDLGDLITEVTGQTIGDQAREHLAGCEQCQREANRWNLVADGIRDLAAEAAEAPQPVRTARTGRRALAGPWRQAMVAVTSAAAALVLLVVIGTAAGLVHVNLSGSGSETATLTSVSGCARLEQADGTLERVNGAGVVIKTASGQLVTVTTTATTRLDASGALLGDITDGAAVTVAGTSSDGTIAADYVAIGANLSLAVPGVVTVRGTVSDAGAAGFTVTSGRTQVPVTTSGATDVTVTNASLGQLQDGASTMAVGHAGPDGTLSALAVVQPPGWPAGAHSTLTLSVRSCSSTAIDHAIGALASGG